MSGQLNPELLATLDQAQELLAWAESITRGPGGRQLSYYYAFGRLSIGAAPPGVAIHFPGPEPLAETPNYSFYATHEYTNHQTNNLHTESCLAHLMFIQTVHLGEKHTLSTQLCYHVVSKEYQLKLERHRTQNEYGGRQDKKMRFSQGDVLGSLAMPNALPAQHGSKDTTVRHEEARQIIEFCKSL